MKAGIAVMVLALAPQGTQPPLGTPMPYTAIHQSEFVAASEATFLQDDDVLLGLCLEGQLKGTQLKQIILVPQFWFAWSQFHQGTRVFTTR